MLKVLMAILVLCSLTACECCPETAAGLTTTTCGCGCP